MKHCNSCNTDKEKCEFGKRAASHDGLSPRCKDCSRAYDKARANNPKRVKAREEYALTDAGKESADRAKRKWSANNKGKVYEATKLYREKNPVKHKAHGMVAYAIKMKNLVSKGCEICGELKANAHHDDYSEPLNIRWLCDRHHNEWHKENGEGLNAS